MSRLLAILSLLVTANALSLSKPFKSPKLVLSDEVAQGQAIATSGLERDRLTAEDVSESLDETEYDYDLIVIGGGSGGLAAAKEAKKYGKRVAVLDYVKPSPLGSQWGLGGTCVNVGCIPKKLMHTAALMGELIKDSVAYGWQLDAEAVKHSWVTMKDNIQSHIKKLNFGYRKQLISKDVKYLNKLGKFIGPNTLELTDSKGIVQEVSAEKFIIAVGGRPTPLECEGNELAVSSDDLFMMEQSPGRTCVVGAGYVALECAGFLSGLHQGEVVVLVRSVPLRSFDQDVVGRILHLMREQMTIVTGVTPVTIKRIRGKGSKGGKGDKGGKGKLLVTYSSGEREEFDTVLAAVGRMADTSRLGLDTIGVQTNPSNGKIICINEQTSIPHIFAVGDVVEGCPELTPVAIHAGKLLARRMYGGSEEQMNYKNIATTVFTPLELGAVGLTEDEASNLYGSEAIEVFESEFEPLEWALNHRGVEGDVMCYIKCIVKKDTGRVVGMHIAAPNAGEIIQGFSLAFRLGITHNDLLDTVGVHPTVAEQFTMLDTARSMGESIEASGC